MNNNLDAILQTYNDTTVPTTWVMDNAVDFHVGFVHGIRKAIEELRSQKKYWYKVIQSAEGRSYGWVHLTEDEAALIAKVSDSNNWINSEIDDWSGSFWIELDSKRKTKPR